MSDTFVVSIGGKPAAAVSTRARANALINYLSDEIGGQKVEVFEFTLDSLQSRVTGNEKPFVVTYRSLADSREFRVAKAPLNRGSIEVNTFDYDSITMRFRVLVWAADTTEAATRAEVRRAALATALGV